MTATEAPRVTIAGGGLAGLTAALRLAERGYAVKIYEQKPMLGGDLGSRQSSGGVELDVYPHMYCNWYRNFWRLHRDVTGAPKEARFSAFDGYQQLARGQYPTFTGVTDMYSPWHVIQNVFSGVGPPADMYVFGYASIDLLAEKLNRTLRLNDVSVNAFLNARPYMTARAAAAYDAFITRVWAIPSYLASASDFRTYLQYAVADPTPAFWLPKGSAQNEVIGPLTKALEEKQVEIVRSVQVVGADCADGRVHRLTLQHATLDATTNTWAPTGDPWTEKVDELIMAVPPLSLVKLIRAGKPGRRMIDAAPELAEISRLRSAQVPMINLFFKRKLGPVPAEPVGLLDSSLCLAFTDISQTWEGVPEFAGRTVLAFSASDIYALPGTGDDDDAHAMLVELAEYLEFDPGRAWGDSPDVDWERTTYNSNADAQLFVNETGSDEWRPAATSTALINLTFAGDFCRNDIGMTTIESAVTTGLEAASAIVARRGVGAPIEIVKPAFTLVDDAVWVWLRYALMPYAAGASAWSWAGDAVWKVAACAGKMQSVLERVARRGHRRES
jgi:hypothetical protein